MTTLINSFEGGIGGTAVSTGNSGGVSGKAFDVVSIGTGATLAYDSTRAAHGSLSCKAATGAASGSSYAEWSTSIGTQTQVWFRTYLYFTANPGSIMRVFQAGGAGTGAFTEVTTAGKLIVGNVNGGATVTTSTAVIPLNAWFRLEGFVLSSTTVGQTELKLFTAADGTVPAETDTSAANLNTGASSAGAFFGTTTNSVGPFWMDDIGLSNTGYIGPVPAGGGPVSITTTPAVVASAPAAGTPTITGQLNVTSLSGSIYLGGTGVSASNGAQVASGGVPLTIPLFAGDSISAVAASGTVTASILPGGA